MTKVPRAMGEIVPRWEWRTFAGAVPTADAVFADLEPAVEESEELYLLSSGGDNVKIRAGLMDECHLFIVPILVGGGKSALPVNVRLELELLEERRFRNGTVFLRYRTSQGRAT